LNREGLKLHWSLLSALQGFEIALTKPKTVFGRVPPVDVEINSASVSGAALQHHSGEAQHPPSPCFSTPGEELTYSGFFQRTGHMPLLYSNHVL